MYCVVSFVFNWGTAAPRSENVKTDDCKVVHMKVKEIQIIGLDENIKSNLTCLHSKLFSSFFIKNV